MKNTEKINFVDLEIIPQLIKDFLNAKLEGFQDDKFCYENLEAKLVEKKNSFTDHKRINLSKILKQQSEECKQSERQIENIEKILKNNTFTITTGHQLNLFSGPVFFIYKIIQVIKTCSYLESKHPDFNFVPIFWMASEDHDFEEINHFKTNNQYFNLKAESGGAVGRISIQDNSFIEDFRIYFANTKYGNELLDLIENAYKIGNSLAQATRFLVNSLFSNYGILIIDGDDPSLKKECIPFFEKELTENLLKHTTQNKVNYLIEKYGKVQVNPRDINLFYLSETRNRIVSREDYYSIVDTNLQFSKDEILSLLHSNPEKFSPNALLRPVYQEVILPNIAYVGGNAEIMYWMELKDYFSHWKLPFPLLIPRNSILNLDEKTCNKVNKMNLTLKDFLGNINSVVRKSIIPNSIITNEINNIEELLLNNFSRLTELAQQTDRTFGNLVAAEKTRQIKSLERMSKRLFRAEKRKQKDLILRLENLFYQINPLGVWQERVFNFSEFYADSGENWLKTCFEEMDVLSSQLIIIVR